MGVIGGLVMVARAEDWHSSYQHWYNYRKPEYILLYHWDSVTETMTVVDSARWDTAAPKILKLPRGVDTATAGFYCCLAYEAFFKDKVMMDSSFYMGATHNSNVDFNGVAYWYEPVHYQSMRETDYPGAAVGACTGTGLKIYARNFGYYHWYDREHGFHAYPYGGIIPLLDTFHVVVESTDSTMGTASGSATIRDLTSHSISARAFTGYRFSHWDDGNYDNPRQVMVTQDTTFKAYFVTAEQRWADIRSNDDSWGHTSGGGTYYEGDTVTITATPLYRCKFLGWSDGDTNTPRQFVIMQDTHITALFAPMEQYYANGLPNDPDRGRVTGSGLYYEHDTVTFEALPWLEYAFARWDDGDTANPRRFAITQDTTMTAIFVSRSGIGTPQEGAPSFTLTPNPATGTVRCTIEEGAAGKGRLTLHDAAGKVVLRRKVTLPGTHDIDISTLPAGVYFATLTTAQGSSTLRLVVE